jgi:hypothetical protein
VTARVVIGVALVAGAAACGDDRLHEEPREPIAGARLAPTWFGYDDGARQLAPDQLYDREQHASCAPGVWGDGVRRCIPIAEEAVFIDDACTQVVGRSIAIRRPTHFIGHDRVDGKPVPTRLYRAGAIRASTRDYYQRRDGVCVGPFAAGDDHVDHEVGDEVDGATLVAIADDEVGGGRLAVRVVTADDGLRLPVGVRDRELAVDCRPAIDADGRVRCRPLAAARTRWFADLACTRPVVIVGADDEAPALAEVVDGDGCPRYHRVGAPIEGPIYRRDPAACVPAPIAPDAVVYDASATVELAELARTVEAAGARRLERIVLAADDLRFVDDRMHDAALAADCRPTAVGDDTRCLPESIASSLDLFTSARCAIIEPVVVLPQPLCGRPRFARAGADAPDGELRAIGLPLALPPYQVSGGACVPLVPPPGALAHGLGPRVDPTLFVGAVRFGER